MAIRYQAGAALRQAVTLLGLDRERVLRRAGLSPHLGEDDEFTVDAEAYFQLWEATRLEADRPDLEMTLAMAYAHGPFLPPIFAFSCADTLALGLKRLAVFKPLMGPMTLEVTRPGGRVRLEMRPNDPTLTIPSCMGLFELLYITECARTFTGVQLSPVETTLPQARVLDAACLEYLGRAPRITGTVSLTFAPEDADRPLITRSRALWESLEPSLTAQLEAHAGPRTMAGQVKSALFEAIPGGHTSVEDLAKRLNVSKRSLQRKLSEEGTSFQALLNETRLEMSERYLRESDLSVPEISFLLGFRDTSSFFRAFQSWTGTTPGDFRTSAPRLH